MNQTVSDDLDVDSPEFDSQKYVKNYLKKHSVQDLIKHHNQLQIEIKDFDQNIQTLVFENYSKFISSIDTVKQMKCDITKVESKMSRLTQSMDRIAMLSRKIDDSLSVKRGEIIKLDTVNKDLSKLNNVCNLPHVIQTDLDTYYRMIQARSGSVRKQPTNFDDYFNNTVVNYSQCFQMLEKYKNEPLIQPIYKETSHKLEQVRQVLWNSLLEFKQQNPLIQLYQNPEASQISTDEARSAVKKLMVLMDDEEGVLKHYQKMIKERYQAIIKELIEKAVVPKQVNDSNSNLTSNDLWKFLEERNFEYSIDDLEEFKQRREKQLNDSTVQGSLLWLINQLCNIVFRQLRKEANFQLIQITQILKNPNNEALSEQCIKEIIYAVFSGLSLKMSLHKLNNFQVNEVFKKLQSELQSLFDNAHLRPRLKSDVIDKFQENVENICRGQVLGSFASLRSQSVILALNSITTSLYNTQQSLNAKLITNDNEYMDLESEIKRDAYAQVTILKQKLTASFLICLLDLRGFVNIQQQGYIKDPTTYVNLIQGSVIDFCRFIPQLLGQKNFCHESLTALALLDTTPNKIKQQILQIPLFDQQGSLYTVFINCFLQLYQRTLQNKLMSFITEVFPNSGVRLPTELEFNKLDKTITIAIQRNLSRFSQKCSQDIIRTFLNIQETNKDGVSKQALNTGTVIKGLLIQIQILFPDQKRGLVKKQPIKRESEGGFNIQMERVMVRKCRGIDINESSSRNNIINSILKYFLKLLLERIKRKVLIQNNENKQLQIDLHFLLQIIYELVSVDEEGLIAGFYLEILDALQQRSQEEIKLNQRQLEGYSIQARQQLKL